MNSGLLEIVVTSWLMLPALNFPHLFAHVELTNRYPFILPAIWNSLFLFITAIIVTLFLNEVRAHSLPVADRA